MGCKAINRYWQPIVMVMTPLLLAVIPLVNPSREARCGYVILVMAIYWMTEVLPLAVTAFIPVFAFPLLGILSTADVCIVYFKETSMVLLGGFTVAIAVGYSNLHQRIALRTILLLGQSPRMLMLAFMLTTMFLSMLISNVATTAMMLPIIDAVLAEVCVLQQEEENGNTGLDLRVAPLHQSQIELVPTSYGQPVVREINSSPAEQVSSAATKAVENSKVSTDSDHKDSSAVPPNEDFRALKEMFFLATAYSANLGGTGCLTGTAPNLVMKAVLSSEPTGLNFLTWSLFNVPGMLICVFLGFLWLQILFMGVCRKKKVIQQVSAERQEAVRKLVATKYKDLGPITFQQIQILVLFLLLLLLWLFRQPEFIPGWSDWFTDAFGVKVDDASPAILIAVLLFLLPARLNFGCFKRTDDPEPDSEDNNACLTWNAVQENLPWNVLFLLGGGFAIATGAKASGLSKWLGEQLYIFTGVGRVWIALGVCFVTAMLTEVASNTAVVSFLLPVVNELALKIKVNPIYLLLPATVCSSYAFMLPAATPPNAIVLGAAGIRTSDMIRAGIVMNIICILVINIMINTLGYAVFELNTMPAWTNSSSTT